MSMFIDTSALYALLDADDENYVSSASTWDTLITSDERIVTTNYVIVETFALIQNRLGLRALREFQDDVVQDRLSFFVRLQVLLIAFQLFR